MPGKLLVLNSGSSSLKYRLFDFQEGKRVLASGVIARIGEPPQAGESPPHADHRQALAELVRRLLESGNLRDESELYAIGHRVVHGGEAFSAAVAVDETVVEAIRAAVPLAPLHNPANLLGIELCRERWPHVPQVAVFDTAFHQTMPAAAYRYALPEEYYRRLRIRRYGFHGTSFLALTRRVAAHLGRPPEALNLIALHLGNGASAVAIRGGRSVDTSMGLTPLAGLMMGTRCGDLDPSVVLYLLREHGLSADEIAGLLNERSGLKGVAGSNDMRDVLARAAEGEASARLGLAMYAYQIRKYIGAYLAVLGRVDAVVFTGGVGEHAAPIRRDALSGLEGLGLSLDETANVLADGERLAELQAPGSAAKILIVPADEELEIAEQTARVVRERAGAASG